MPAMATLTLNNDAAAPVNYQVLGIKNGVASWADVSQGTVGGYRTVSLETRRPADPTKQVQKIIAEFTRPYVNATTGLVEQTLRGKIELWIPPASSLQEKKELHAEVKNFAAHAFFLAAAQTQEGMY